jgi:predicted nucleic acid-binding protein
MALDFLDTNVLLYAVGLHPAETRKQEIAQTIIDADRCALSVQVLQEFYVQATQATRPRPLSHGEACKYLKVWRRFPIQDNSLAIFDAALAIRDRHALSFWDANVVAAAQHLGCDRLISEDLSDGQRFGSLKIFNPFA